LHGHHVVLLSCKKIFALTKLHFLNLSLYIIWLPYIKWCRCQPLHTRLCAPHVDITDCRTVGWPLMTSCSYQSLWKFIACSKSWKSRNTNSTLITKTT
jgi:hypothetical protein